MGKFRYEAEDKRGNRVRGALEASSLADAQEKLRGQGLEPLEVLLAEDEAAAEAGRPLSERQAEQVMVQVAELSSAQVPLAAGLRAAAQESTEPRVARALRSIAHDLEQGRAIETVLSQRGKSLPAHVRGLVAAAVRTGRLGPALDELVDQQRSSRDAIRGALASIAYPMIVLGLTVLLLSFLPLFVVPQFRKMFEEFELQLPKITELLISTSDLALWLATGGGAWILLALVVLSTAAFFGAPVLLSAARSRRILVTVPLVGPLWNWCGAAAFCRLLAVLLDSGLPLSEALRLTGDGLRDANLREFCQYLSKGVDDGRKFSEILATTPRLPASMVPLVRWGEKTGELPDALRSASEMFLGRVRLRSSLLRSIAPPLVFILVFIAVGFMLVSLFLPLVSLIQGLS